MQICKDSLTNYSDDSGTNTDQDLDDTFDDESFDEIDALKQIEFEEPNLVPKQEIKSELPSSSTVSLPSEPQKSSYLEENVVTSNSYSDNSYECKVCGLKSRGMPEYLKHLTEKIR